MSVQTVGVIGGGALGLTAAVELAKRDVSVTVFERDELGSGATGRAAGICYDAYADRRDGAIAVESLERFRELGLLQECPYLWFAREDDEIAAAIESQARRMQENGRDVSLLEADSLGDRFPGLITDDIEIAAVARNSGYLDTTRYIDALADEADRTDVTVRTGSPATVEANGKIQSGAETHAFDAVLVAAGARSKQVLAKTNVELAVGLYRTQVLTAGPLEGELPIYYDASEEWYARPTSDGILAGDGSHMYEGSPGSYERSADEEFITGRLDLLENRVGAGLRLRDSWAGLCTATPDRNPLLGECDSGIYVGTGLCGHGFMRAPALGKRVAVQILGEDGIDAFDPQRFDGDEEIDLPVGVTD